MKNTQPYIERIKIASLAKGVVLDDKQALEVLTRTVGLVTTETGTPEPCLTTETGTPEPLEQSASLLSQVSPTAIMADCLFPTGRTNK